MAERVSFMLLDIERDGIDAVRHCALELDGEDLTELNSEQIRTSGDQLSPALREAIELGAERTGSFARMQREHLSDFEAELLPGLVVGQKYLPLAAWAPTYLRGDFPSRQARS